MPGAVEVEFRVLGPVEVSASGRVLAPAEPRQRAVLAALVVDVGRTVPTETLIDRVWGDRPPAQARRTLHAHLSRVRGRARRRRPAAGARPGGYRLAVASEQLDLHRFRALAARAQDDAVPPGERAALLREALRAVARRAARRPARRLGRRPPPGVVAGADRGDAGLGGGGDRRRERRGRRSARSPS